MKILRKNAGVDVKYSQMEERLNIWGKTGCNLPDGGLCRACCVLPDIELEGSVFSVGKPENSLCPYLNQSAGGCTLEGKGKPDNCTSWDCSKASNEYKLDLIAQSLALKDVTIKEAIDACNAWLGDPAENTKMRLIDESERLKILTTQKDLITRDLVEP